MIVFGGLRAKTCLDCLNWMVLALSDGEFFFAALDCVSVLKCSVQQDCVLIFLSVCGAFSIFVRENTLCFLESTCQNRFLSPVAGCRMVVSDQRSQPTVGVQTPRRQELQKRSPHTESACETRTDLPEKFGK